MSIRILTKTGEQITHIDDARAYNFDAGNKSGIVKGVFNEGNFFASPNGITIDSCELRIAGHRVVIDSAESIALNNSPSTNTRYSMIAEIAVDTSSIPTFKLFIQQSTTTLRQDNLYKTEAGSGIYQLEIGRFTLTTDGQIKDLIRTADLITGMSDNENQYWEVGNITANMIDSGLPANVDIDFNEDTKKYDFNFDIPKSSGSSNVIANNGEETTEELDTLMVNDINYKVPKPVKSLQSLPIANASSPDFINIDGLDGSSKLYRKMVYTNTFDGSDLTNTVWKFNREINTNPTQTFNINFTSNNVEFNRLVRIYYSWMDYRMEYYPVSGGYWNVYEYHYESGGYTTWSYGYEYQTIKITGGADVTNTDLIAFLQANATIQIGELQYKYVEIIDKYNINEVNTGDLIFNLNISLRTTPTINSIITFNDLSNSLVNSYFNKTPNIGDYVSRIICYVETDEVTETYLITGTIQSIGETVDLAPSGTATPYELLVKSVQKIAYNGSGSSGGGVGGSSLELLWTNENPTSEFTAQTITLNGEGYEFYLILYKNYITEDRCSSGIVKIGHGYELVYDRTETNAYMTNSNRLIISTSSSNIVFDDAYFQHANQGNATKRNDCVIPFEIYGVKNGSSGSVLNENIYSTEETVIGKWIDGKPLYGKVINFTFGTSFNTWVRLNHNIENIDSCFIRNAFLEDGTTLPDKWTQLVLSPSLIEYTLNSDAQYQNKVVTLCVAYTKTTDL